MDGGGLGLDEWLGSFLPLGKLMLVQPRSAPSWPLRDVSKEPALSLRHLVRLLHRSGQPSDLLPQESSATCPDKPSKGPSMPEYPTASTALRSTLLRTITKGKPSPRPPSPAPGRSSPAPRASGRGTRAARPDTAPCPCTATRRRPSCAPPTPAARGRTAPARSV